MPIRCNDADGLSNGVSTTVVPSLSPTIKPSVVVVVVFGVGVLLLQEKEELCDTVTMTRCR